MFAVKPNVRAKPTVEADAGWPRKDNTKLGLERLDGGCRSGSALERGVRPHWRGGYRQVAGGAAGAKLLAALRESPVVAALRAGQSPASLRVRVVLGSARVLVCGQALAPGRELGALHQLVCARSAGSMQLRSVQPAVAKASLCFSAESEPCSQGCGKGCRIWNT